MKPAPFEYHAPRSIDEALALLAQHGDDAKLLAGGQSLLPVMNFRLAKPAVLIDLNRVPGLDHLGTEGGALRIGAMVRQRALERSAEVARLQPLLAETVPFVAHPQIRNRGTVGGSIAHADPAGELPAIAVALDASLRIRGPNGERRVAARDFFVALFTTDLGPEEMLTEIEIPAADPDCGWSFKEIARRHGDYAQVGVAARVALGGDGRCRAARLVYLSVGDVPIDARAAADLLLGEAPTAEVLEAAARTAAQSEVEPVTDIHATEAYKRRLTAVLTRRALETAVERARRREAIG